MKKTNRTNRWPDYFLSTFLSLVLAAGTGTGLSAQQTSTSSLDPEPLRQGFHFSIGVGSASVSASCPGCDVDFFTDRINGLSGNIQLGGALNSRLVMAAEATGWLKNDEPIYRRIAALNLVVLGYPSETAGFFLKGGAGVLRAIVEDDFSRAQTDAFTAVTGVGYDIPLGGGTKLTAYVNYLRTFGGETWFNGVVSPVVVTPDAIQFGTALTIH